MGNYNSCPSCQAKYGKYDDEGLMVLKCKRCGKTYCWACNDYSNQHKCSDGVISDSSEYLGSINSRKEDSKSPSENKNKKGSFFNKPDTEWGGSGW
jgi:hypothetical protein